MKEEKNENIVTKGKMAHYEQVLAPLAISQSTSLCPGELSSVRQLFASKTSPSKPLGQLG